MEAAIARAWRRLHKPRVRFTVEPVLFLYMFASFLSYPVFQQLLHSMVCEQTANCSSATPEHLNSSAHSRCYVPSETEQVVQSKTSHWILYINLASGLPSIVVAAIYGSLSDQMGRRFFMALPAIGSIINTAVILVVVYLQPGFPIPYLLLGAFVAGLYGSFSVINFAVYSYASDISAHSKRTVQISVLESMTYLSATLSFIIGGFWIKSGHFAPPFWSIMGCQCVILLYIVVFLPESLQPSGAHVQTPSTCRRLCSSIVHNLTGFGALLRLSSWRMVTLLVMFFIIEINFLGITDTVVLYTLGEPLCWSSDWIGYFLALKVFLNGLAALLVLPVLVYFKMPDTVIIMVGLVASAGALILMGLSTHTWMMLIVPVIGAMRGTVVPVIRSMLSKLVPSDKQGILFSGVSMVESACSLVASVLYNALYPATRQLSPGFCFFLMAGTLTLPFILTLVLHLRRRQCSGVSGREGEAQPLLQSSAVSEKPS